MKKTISSALVTQIRAHVGEGGDIVGDFFGEIHKEYGDKPYIEVRDFENSDSRLSTLIVDDKLVASVIEIRTAFNHCEYTLMRLKV